MRLILSGATVVTAHAMHQETITLDTHTGRIIPNSKANKRDLMIDLSGYMLFPGLINAHDHLELNHFPRTKFQNAYANAHQWGDEFSTHLHESPFQELRGLPLRDRCFIGGLKNIISGVTTVAHHNPFHRPLRSSKFPVNVVSRYGWAHSLHFSDAATIKAQFKASAPHPFIIHLAEGIDSIASDELSQLDKLGCLTERTILVHGVGLTSDDARLAIERRANLVWCPSTNYYLLGQTANIEPWQMVGQVALGSDSRLTADGNLLDEMRSAFTTQQAMPQDIFQMVTTSPTKMLALRDVGKLEIGRQADLIALPLNTKPFESLIQSRRADLSLVVKRGQIMVANPAIANLFPKNTLVPCQLDHHPKLLAKSIAKMLKRSTIQEEGLQLD